MASPLPSKEINGDGPIVRAPSDDDFSPEKSVVDVDELRLAELGYSQDMQRKFSVWSVLGIGFSLTNSWFGISASSSQASTREALC